MSKEWTLGASCKVCKFFFRPDEVYTVWAQGACRRHPPLGLQSGAKGACWPDVWYSDWCGEFRPNQNLLADAQPQGNAP